MRSARFNRFARASTRCRVNGTRHWRRERRVATRPMKGERAQQVPLPRAPLDCPLLAGYAAATSCPSSPSQPHCSPSTHTACWLCPLCSQMYAFQHNLTVCSPARTSAGRKMHAATMIRRNTPFRGAGVCRYVDCMFRLACLRYGVRSGLCCVVCSPSGCSE